MLIQRVHIGKILTNNKEIQDYPELVSLAYQYRNPDKARGKRCKSCAGLSNEFKQDLYLLLSKKPEIKKYFQRFFGTHTFYIYFQAHGQHRKELHVIK